MKPAVLYVLLGLGPLLLLLLVGLFLLRRYGRLVRVTSMSARLSASWLGAWVRRALLGKEQRQRLDQEARRRMAAEITRTMGDMKGALMKLGQIVSFINDDIPVEYREALRSLQTQAPPLPFPVVRDVLETELGRPLERAFAWFDDKALAAASIGQVHRATLPDGQDVVVKVQYPGVAEAIRGDLDNAALLYRFLGMMYPNMDPAPVVAEIRARISEELDYEREADNQAAFHALYEGHPFIRVPRVVRGYTTARVLTSEYVAGRGFYEVLKDDQEARDRYGEIIYRFVFGSIMRYRVFNADPHPGNYLFDAEGRVVFLDFGCVKYFRGDFLAIWKELVRRHLAGDPAGFRQHLVQLHFIPEGSDVSAELIYDHFSYFYEAFSQDRVFQFTPAYNSRSLRHVFAPEGKFAGLSQKLNMPQDFVFVNRIQWGAVSVLSQLQARGNWHRIKREYLYGDAPSTELGARSAEFRHGWRQRRGLHGEAEVYLTPEGLVPAVG